jgi:two-component system cell cycle sensor histidine kinase/response regulator CckA
MEDQQKTKEQLLEENRELRSSEEKYRTFFQESVEGMLVADAETKKFLHANPSICEMLGYTEEELLKLSVNDIHPHDDLQRVIAEFEKQAMGEKQMAEDLPVLRKDGTVFYADIMTSPLSLNGRCCVVGCFTNITKRRQAEERLREGEERYRGIFENTSNGAAVYEAVDDGEDFVLVDFNPAAERIEKTDKKDLIGKRVTEVFPGVKEYGLLNVFRRVWKSGNPEHYPIKLYRDERIEGWRENFVYRLPTEEVVAVYSDITELKQAEAERRSLEAQFQQAQKMESLGILAGGIAHDFNNLLMGILGNAEIALRDLSPDSAVRGCIQDIETAGRRAADLTKQMLAYSGKGFFHTEILDLNTLITETEHLLRSAASSKATFELDLAKDLAATKGDATQVRQVVMNLITNASESLGDETGHISIRTGMRECNADFLKDSLSLNDPEPGPYVWFEVSDTGCGMTKETSGKIFDPFFTTKFTGRGLGLSAVLGIVRGHNGAIMLKSQIGQGTTFSVYLPASAQAAVTKDEEEPEDDWRGSGTVLLVDDEEIVRGIGKRMLERIGFKTLIAKSGREALGVLQANLDEIDCVLLDLTMPNMDGEETFQKLRLIKSDVPIVLSSGFGEKGIARRFAGIGLNGFIQKPYRVGTLKDTMRQVLSR